MSQRHRRSTPHRRVLHRPRWHRFALAVVVVLAGVQPVPAQAQAATSPDSFAIDTAATGMLIEVSAPAALPLDVLAGLSYAQVGVNRTGVRSAASPLFVPLVQDVALLGGPSGVLGIGARLAPGLVVGLPTLVGLDPLPVDPSIVPVEPLASFLTGLPVPPIPPLGCTSAIPENPPIDLREAECGGGAQDFFGFRVGAASARTVAEGEVEDPSTLASRSDSSVAGISPSGGQPFAPFSAAAMGATADGRILEGRAVTTASASVGSLDLAGAFGFESVEAAYAGAVGGTAETLEESVECNIVGAEFGGQAVKLGTDSLTVPGQELELPSGGGIGSVADLLGRLGGQLGPVDIGNVTITPNPEPVAEVSEDGTSVLRRFACLEIRYRILTSGTDVRITLGNIAVSLNAQSDTPFSPDGGGGTDVAGDGGDFGGGTDLGDGGIDLGGSPPSLTGGGGGDDFALPETPTAGGEAPEPSEEPFATSVSAAGWGIDGGWLAPFALLALSLPLLARARTFAPAPRPTRS